MRYREIAGGYRLVLSDEEQEMLDHIADDPALAKMDERQQEVARKMVSRGLLRQCKTTAGLIYKVNSTEDIWRDR